MDAGPHGYSSFSEAGGSLKHNASGSDFAGTPYSVPLHHGSMRVSPSASAVPAGRLAPIPGREAWSPGQEPSRSAGHGVGDDGYQGFDMSRMDFGDEDSEH